MNTFTRKSFIISLIVPFSIASCGKKNGSDPTPGNSKPSISSVSITAGPYDSQVVITGTGFGATAANDQVFFNGKAATIVGSFSTQITATVPLGAGTGNISVSVNGTTATGPVFTYVLSEVKTPFAGSGAIGSADGQGLLASFSGIRGVAADVLGNIYVADSKNNLVRKVSPTGLVTTVAGSGIAGKADGTGTSASFNNPVAVAVDATENVYVADANNNLIRKISPLGVVTTLAGSGLKGFVNGAGNSASFNNPIGIAVDAAGNVFVSEWGNNSVRKITADGVVSTLAGNGYQGSNNGAGSLASFYVPEQIAVDADDNVYVADYGNNLIRKISPAGIVSTLAGGTLPGKADGTGTSASFSAPCGIALDAAGNVYAAEYYNALIRRVTPGGVVTTISGISIISSSMAIDASGSLFLCEPNSNLVYKISLE